MALVRRHSAALVLLGVDDNALVAFDQLIVMGTHVPRMKYGVIQQAPAKRLGATFQQA